MKDRNLSYIEKECFLRTSAHKAFKNFSKWSDDRLRWILRHHDETDEGIPDNQTWLRDEFDYLLGFYGVIEIALMIGFITETPESFFNEHLQILSHPAVRRYYEWNYPLELPGRLRDRLTQRCRRTVKEDAALVPRFYTFLELTRIIERDEDVESFLWTLDGGWREDEEGECDIDRVRKCLTKPRMFVAALQVPKKERSEIDRALNGFYKFIQFCEAFDRLIIDLREIPDVSEAMWLYHAYWFMQFETEVGGNLRSTLEVLLRWRTDREGGASIKTRVCEMEAVIRNLAIPPLAAWKSNQRNAMRIKRIQAPDVG